MTQVFLSLVIFLTSISMVIGQHSLSNGGWMFRSSADSAWTPCSIPGNNYSALLENHLIDHPYKNDQVNKLSWVDSLDWYFKKEFILSDSVLDYDHVDLVCPGLDTYCSILLNGQLLGQTNNSFMRYRFSLKSIAKPGVNSLVFIFKSAKIVSDSLYSALPNQLPGGPRTTVRKPQFHFGWDFAPTLISCGITEAPVLETWNQSRIEEAALNTLSVADSNASLQLNLQLVNGLDSIAPCTIRFRIGQATEQFSISLNPGSNHIIKAFTLSNPILWWPNGYGKQHLYDCQVTLLDSLGNERSTKTWKHGIRTIQLIAEPDTLGMRFLFRINGQDLFIKGSNYVPDDAFDTRSQRWVQLLDAAEKSHFNMLRIWGGGQYESDAFYEMCDAKGILIWQDFMFACAMYPGDSGFLASVYQEASQQIARLSKHCCIALYCGNNENNEGWHRWGWQTFMSSSTKDRLWEDYQKVFHQLLPEAVAAFHPTASYWPSSPLYGRGDDRFQTDGDAHDWGLWHDEMPFEKLEQRIPRFMSEFGFQSFPALSTMQQYTPVLPEDGVFKGIGTYQKHPRGNELILKYLKRDYPEPTQMEGLIYLNQVCQAEGISGLIRAHRIARPYCMGSLYWQFNDCWPGISWSGIDYRGHWKALQHAVQRAFRPILFHGTIDAEGIDVFAVNDRLEPQLFSLELTVQDFAGNSIYYQVLEDTLPPNRSKQIHRVPLAIDDLEIGSSHYLLLKTNLETDTFYHAIYFERPKQLALTDPEIIIKKISINDSEDVYELTAAKLARNVYLKETDEYTFSPNYFDLHPGIPVRIQAKKQNKQTQVKVAAISLFDFLK